MGGATARHDPKVPKVEWGLCDRSPLLATNIMCGTCSDDVEHDIEHHV